MEFLISAATDVGIRKKTNQDSLMMRQYETHLGNVVLMVLCDGMGGFDKGEVASSTVVNAFAKWAEEELACVSNHPDYDHMIRQQWTNLITELNIKIANYGKSQGIKLGTTVVAMLLTPTRYYLMNVGDSRAYEMHGGQVYQLTKDQTFVAREVEMGRMTPEQAEVDPRKSVLLQCVGASEMVYPDMFYGDTTPNATYMLCSDGFRHEITPEEIYSMIGPERCTDCDTMEANIRYLIDLNIRRNEVDNITASLVKTY